jgi:hypothetical protein
MSTNHELESILRGIAAEVCSIQRRLDTLPERCVAAAARHVCIKVPEATAVLPDNPHRMNESAGAAARPGDAVPVKPNGPVAPTFQFHGEQRGSINGPAPAQNIPKGHSTEHHGLQKHSVGDTYPWAVVGIGNGAKVVYEVHNLVTGEVLHTYPWNATWMQELLYQRTQTTCGLACEFAAACKRGAWREYIRMPAQSTVVSGR